MLIRKVLKWAALLLLLLAAVGGYAVMRAWERRDAMLLAGIRAEVAQRVPDWDVHIEEAKLLNTRGQVRLREISVRPRGETIAIVHIPECYITVDPDLLLNVHQVLIREVRVSRPTVTLVRHADGIWNWQKLTPPPPSEQTPEVLVESGAFVVRVEASGGLPETEIASREVTLRLIPAGLHRYLIEGASQIDGAGGLSFSGKGDLNTGAWELAGKADGLDMSPSLVEKAYVISPAVQRQVAELSNPGTGVIPGAASQTPSDVRTPLIQPTVQFVDAPVATSAAPAPAASQLSVPYLGLTANIALEFAARSDGVQKIPDYRVVAKVMQGQVTEPLSPVPLENLQGELLLENDRVVIHRVSAANGESQLNLDGEVLQGDLETVKRFNLRATNLWLDPQVRLLLPPERQRLFDLINPSGRFTVAARYDSQAEKPFQLDQLTAIDVSIRHQLFQYPIDHLAGTIQQEEAGIRMALEGVAAERPVRISGWIGNPGPNGEPGDAVVDIETSQFPIDERFTDAITSPDHQEARSAIESLNLTGLADLRVRFERSDDEDDGPQDDERFVMTVDADVSQATMSFRGFPYTVENLSGRISYHPERERVWRFSNLRGQHGPAMLDGEARFDLEQQPGQLVVAINAQNAPLDQDLRQATVTAEAALERVWTELNPSGWMHLDGLIISWVPDTSPQVSISKVRLERGTVMAREFPYRWHDVTALLRWENGRVEVQRAAGRHNGTFIEIKGDGPDDPAFFELATRDFNWVLHLPQISIKDVDPRGEFADALPEAAADVLKTLNPHGPLNCQLWMEMKGWPDEHAGETVTSAWWLNVEFNQDRLSAGLDFTEVTGQVEAVVKWDTDHVVADGRIDFERARALDMTLANIRGPFRVEGTELTVGSAALLRPTPLKVPSDEQLTAALYGGVVKLNAIAQLDAHDSERSTYQLHVDVDNADLSQWATEWGAGGYNIAGTVNSVMKLRGRGSSPLALQGEDCRVQITDARLGELPQIAQLLVQFTPLRQPDKTWFQYAYAEFSIRNGLFDFGSPASRVPGDTRRIQVDGDIIKMVGRGTIPFAPGIDPRMNLVFRSKIYDRNRLIQNIPLISPIARSMMDNWFGVEVAGTPTRPSYRVTTQVPVDNANDALREIFTSFESGLMPMLPQPAP
ncbi:MAG: hypothetical protein KF861_00500 [Planctomycetaceae bacterium]|nr:hypothetical protein [Planctomycetaceae bacterium]